jgi:hypothetical protein
MSAAVAQQVADAADSVNLEVKKAPKVRGMGNARGRRGYFFACLSVCGVEESGRLLHRAAGVRIAPGPFIHPFTSTSVLSPILPCVH